MSKLNILTCLLELQILLLGAILAVTRATVHRLINALAPKPKR